MRTIQDWYVRFLLMASETDDKRRPVAEVASVGGFVQEYQVDVDPDALRGHGVSLEEVFDAVRLSNADVGARTIEVNRVEYVIRGLGFIRGVQDIENTVVKAREGVPLYVRNVARVTLGPALRDGALDKDGAEAVGGVVVVRHGENPLAAIQAVRKKIEEIAPALARKPVLDHSRATRAQVEEFAAGQGFAAYDGDRLNRDGWLKWLTATPRNRWPAWINVSQVTVVPFYDRTGLIYETLNTLNEALVQEIVITVLVVVISLFHLRSSILISGVLPLSVLVCFIAMKQFGVDANIVALSGIAIAIGTMVDMGIVLCDNIMRHLDEADPAESRLEVIYRASSEVGSAVLAAISTTVVSFLPVFAMTGAEGKLFKPLAFTKTFALLASVVVALTILPAGALILFTGGVESRRLRRLIPAGLIAAGAAAWAWVAWWAGAALMVIGAYHLIDQALPERGRRLLPWLVNALAVGGGVVLLTQQWLPLGPGPGLGGNLAFTFALVGGIMAFFVIYERVYGRVLMWCLRHKLLFLSVPTLLAVLGLVAWLGFEGVFGFVPAWFPRVV
jgi:Cu(I)/Ag(I) efflux system membrane protein CusA/SilA